METDTKYATIAHFTGTSLSDGSPLGSRYEVLEEVGKGTMGKVFRATHRTLRRPVAIKVMLPGGSAERFLREAQLLAQIRSPHVVAVHDFDVLPDGSSMLVMEWVAPGTTLQHTLNAENGPIAEDRVLPWMRQVAEGMKAAADQGIIHRDLKPSNILIDERQHARVADFGLARGQHAGLGDLTNTGGVMGTAYYMAPEQAEDPRGVDTRADVYSFGATFYQVLTGSVPFDGKTAFSVLYKHKSEPLDSPRSRNPRLSLRTSEVLERCLAKSPAERFGSFGELLATLQPSSATSPWETDDPELASYLTRFRSQAGRYLNERKEGELDVYPFPHGRTLRIVRGSIVDQRVQALVSSDNFQLTMAYGVSGAIRAAGGERIAEYARALTPVRPGRAVVTPAGTLPARFIFHAVTNGADSSRAPRVGPGKGPGRVSLVMPQWVQPSRDLIIELLGSCFYHAESLEVRSMAIPLLGTGLAGFSRDVCLETTFHFLARTLLRGLTPVEDVRIVLYP